MYIELPILLENESNISHILYTVGNNSIYMYQCGIVQHSTA
jgi:hypothetical protein